MFYCKIVKRILDFICALTLLVILVPLFLLIIIIIYVNLGSPVFFRQVRPGKDEEAFQLIKFRSMNNKKDANGELLPDKDRLNKIRFVLTKIFTR